MPNEKTILVIDDEEDSRVLLKKMYQDLGLRVVIAKSVTEGLALARKSRPDLISLDLFMPETSGWTGLMHLKEDSALRDIPVIVVSIATGDNSGIFFRPDDFVAKPIERDALKAAVRRHLPVVGAAVLVVEDSPSDQKLIAACLANGQTEVTIAENGRRALESMETSAPDLIVLDLMMPEMDGFAFLEKLREHPQHSAVPVVVLTAKQLSTGDLDLLRQKGSIVLPKGSGCEEHLRRSVEKYIPMNPN